MKLRISQLTISSLSRNRSHFRTELTRENPWTSATEYDHSIFHRPKMGPETRATVLSVTIRWCLTAVISTRYGECLSTVACRSTNQKHMEKLS